jgi:hypothetical protein
MNWGRGIVISFVLFAVFIGVLTFICVRQDVALVSPDYYKQELAYQQRIDDMQNADDLKEKPGINVIANDLEISFSTFTGVEGAQINLFRPSDSRLDRKFNFKVENGLTQRFDIGNLPRGKYEARMTWTMNGKQYYLEKTLVL